jgi:zinc transport system substrate-binding protein
VKRVLVFACLFLGVAGCGGTDTSADAEKTVVAAFYPLAWAAQQVGGDRVDVVNLTPPGVEPHDIELTPGDVERVRDADLVLYLGEGFMPALEDAVAGNGKALDLLAGKDLFAAEDESATDPHIWLDPMRYATVVRAIAEALDMPEAADSLVARLTELDSDFREGLASCERRRIVTSHAAFAYLADAYELDQLALTGLSPEAEPSPRALEALVNEVGEEGATTVFFETLVSPGLAETVARETGARTAALDPLEGLTEDEVADGEDYFSVMRENLAVLREALGCH